jgi:hypothetical protein
MSQCFFFVEADLQDTDDGTIRALCMDCGQKKRLPSSWFYDGQFGPWTVKCHVCNQDIHIHEDSE